jgi:hypothetical protein
MSGVPLCVVLGRLVFSSTQGDVLTVYRGYRALLLSTSRPCLGRAQLSQHVLVGGSFALLGVQAPCTAYFFQKAS